MWRATIKTIATIEGFSIGITGLIWGARVAEDSPGMMFLIFLITALIILVTLAPMMILAEISEGVEDLRADIMALERKIEGKTSKIDKQVHLPQNNWKCSNCGRENPATSVRCSCGWGKGE